MKYKAYDVGHKVMLVLGPFDNVPEGVRKHDQEVYRISRAYSFKGEHYYELKGLKSKEGIPYSIHEEWLYDIQVWTG